jgi:hypothetical protein
MYETLDTIHIINRWLLIPVMILVIILSLKGSLSKSPFGKLDNALGGALVGLAHLQLVIGLVLLHLHDWDLQFRIMDNLKPEGKGIGAIEHVSVGIVGVLLIQLGRTLGKKAPDAASRHKKVAIFTIIAALLIISRQPHWHF